MIALLMKWSILCLQSGNPCFVTWSDPFISARACLLVQFWEAGTHCSMCNSCDAYICAHWMAYVYLRLNSVYYPTWWSHCCYTVALFLWTPPALCSISSGKLRHNILVGHWTYRQQQPSIAINSLTLSKSWVAGVSCMHGIVVNAFMLQQSGGSHLCQTPHLKKYLFGPCKASYWMFA